MILKDGKWVEETAEPQPSGLSLVDGKWVSEENPDDFSFSEMAKNIPESIKQLAIDSTAPIHSPVETYEGVAKIFGDMKSKVSDSLSNAILPDNYETERPAFDAIGQHFSDRYGSIQGFKDAAEKDPAGIASDLVGVLSMGSGLAAKAPGQTAKILAKRRGTAKDKMLSAMKMGTTLDKNTPLIQGNKIRNQNADTMLKYKIMPTEEGMIKAGTILEEKSKVLDDIIANAPNKNFFTQDILSELEAVKNKAGQTSVAKANAVQSIIDDLTKARGTFNADGELIGMKGFSARQLLDYKRELYDDINWNKPKGNIKNKARQAAARKAKENIETISPEVKKANKVMENILTASKTLKQSSGRISNRDAVGIGMPIKMTAGAAIGSQAGNSLGSLIGLPNVGSGIGSAIGSGIGYLNARADLPLNKAQAAINLYNSNPASALDLRRNADTLARIGLMTPVLTRAMQEEEERGY